jgi:4'-phosphopantetheinyl transferase
MSGAETAAFDALPTHARAPAFLRAWTCKEAYVKATGEGLSLLLPRITVALSGPARRLHVEGRGGEATSWTLHDLAMGWDVVGALAAPHGADLRWFDHPDMPACGAG